MGGLSTRLTACRLGTDSHSVRQRSLVPLLQIAHPSGGRQGSQPVRDTRALLGSQPRPLRAGRSLRGPVRSRHRVAMPPPPTESLRRSSMQSDLPRLEPQLAALQHAPRNCPNVRPTSPKRRYKPLRKSLGCLNEAPVACLPIDKLTCIRSTVSHDTSTKRYAPQSSTAPHPWCCHQIEPIIGTTQSLPLARISLTCVDRNAGRELAAATNTAPMLTCNRLTTRQAATKPRNSL